MKHVVNLVVSQPDHDFISMRGRKQEKTCIQEANTPEEAMNRATRRMKNLGFYVHGASIVEQKAPEAPAAKPLTEGVAEVQAAQEKRKAAMKKATAEVDKSEVQDKAGKAQAGSALATYLKNKASTMKEEVETTSAQYIEEKLSAADPASKWIHDFVHSDNPKFEGKSKAERIKMALGAKYAANKALKEDAEQIEEGRVTEVVAEGGPFSYGKTPRKGSVAANAEQKRKEQDRKTPPIEPKDQRVGNAKITKGVAEGRAMDYKMSRSSVAGDRGDSKGGEINVSQKDREEIAKILGAKDDKKQDKKLEENAELEEAVSRKDFKQVAGIIKEIPDAAKRKEIAQHHAEIFANQNPRFDRNRFYAAAGVNLREEATVKTQKYSWGTMKTVHHGSDFSIPLHPEHHQEIAKLKDEQEHHFKDETGRHWTARRKGEDVHFQGANGGDSTKVKHSTMSEEVEEAKAEPVAKAKELLDQAEKGTYKGSAAKLQKALEKAKSRNFDQGKGYKLEEGAEQLDETGVVKKTNKTLKNVMAAAKGARLKAQNPEGIPAPEPEHKTAQAYNKALGRAVMAMTREEAEGTAPKTPKEKELAAKAGDPNKITKKDVLAARGVKLDEVKGSFKDQATEKAEDERLAKKEVKDSKSAKAAETIINLAKSKKNKINMEPKVEGPGHGIGGGGAR